MVIWLKTDLESWPMWASGSSKCREKRVLLFTWLSVCTGGSFNHFKLGRNDWKTETIANDKRFIISVKWRTGWVHKMFWIIQFWSPFLGFEIKWSLTYYIKMLGYFTTYRFAVKARSWLLCMYKILWPRIQLQKTRLAVFVCFFVFRICF